MSKKGLELLSPAGSPDIARAVINAGADAIYFGGELFGARAYATNFNRKEGADIIRYGHLHGVKSYLTINTLLKNTEMERKLYDYARAYYEAGVDAILVQDPGVFDLLREHFPGLALHASTQMTVANIYGARLLQEEGFQRVVLSREISIDEMARIHQACPVELEAFVHGALCVCYSGQCYMSSMFGGRSGNRGRCAQPCRLPYTVLDDCGRRLPARGPYLLSMKDLCGVRDIPALDAAGVCSLKIEGRMKQMSYALGVVRVYRAMIDRYLERGAEDFHVDDKTIERLLDLGNRKGFTSVWLHENNAADMITYTEASHQHRISQVEPAPEKKYLLDGRLTLQEGRPMSLQAKIRGSASSCRLTGDLLEPAEKRAAREDSVLAKFLQLGDTAFIPGDFRLEIIGSPFVPVASLKRLRRQMTGLLTDQLLAEKMGCPPAEGLGKREARPLHEITGPGENPVCRKGSLSASLTEVCQLKYLLQRPEIAAVYCPLELLLAMEAGAYRKIREETSAAGQKLYLAMPPVFRAQSEAWLERLLVGDALASADGFLVSSLDALGYLKEKGIEADRIILGERLYSMNHRAVALARSRGYRKLTAPVELNRAELSHRDNRGGIIPVYGHLPLMITTNCLYKDLMGCDHRPHSLFLEDRKGRLMPVLNHCASCYNLIYNQLPTMLLDQIPDLAAMGFQEFRLDFTRESPDEMDQIIGLACRSMRGETVAWQGAYTRGHYHRGVE